MKWDFFRDHVMTQFRALTDFLSHSEAQLQESHHTARAEIGSGLTIPPGASGEDVQELLSQHEYEIEGCDHRYKIAFARMLRFSVVIMCFTLVESNLSRIAREIVKRNQLSLDMEDLQAKNLVKRFEKFWTKVAGLTWWQDTSKWELLKDVEELRNCIAHRNGVVRDNDARVRRMIKDTVGVGLVSPNDALVDPDDAGTVVIEARYCRRIVEELAGLMNEVFERAGCFGPEHPIIEND